MPISFLTVQQVAEIHDLQIQSFGGKPGLYSSDLLESSVAAPLQRFNYDSTATIYDLAAVYAYSLSHNHAFVDGNKRVALHSALVFLEINGVEVTIPEDTLYDAMIGLVVDRITKESFAAILHRFSNPN